MIDLSGTTIKEYIVRRKVAEGGFGAIYNAYQPLGASAGREVALKVIRPQFANLPGFAQRFEAEARLVARLEHPHIVPLYDYWRDPGGQAYLVMRWMPGGSLADLLRHGPLEPATVVKIIDQVAAGLAYAHTLGVIHRDLKPANILLDREGNAYLADFGIAASPSLTAGTPLSEARAFTPGYAAPEQILLDPATLQSDIYSLGVMLYELLTGVAPFEGVTPGEIVKQQLAKQPLHIRDRRPDLPAELDAIIQRATAYDLRTRYSNALELAVEVHQVLTPVAARQRVADQRTIVLDRSSRNSSDRHFPRKVLFGLFGSIIAVLLLGLLPKQFVTQNKEYRVLIDTSHDAGTITEYFTRVQMSNFKFVPSEKREFTASTFAGYDAVIIWFGENSAPEDASRDFTPSEINAIKTYIHQGGGVLLVGLGWVWTSYEKRPIEDYPLNLIAQEYGIFFDADIVSSIRTQDAAISSNIADMNAQHPISRNLQRVSTDPKAHPSSLQVKPPAIPIIWGDYATQSDNGMKSPVVVAAVETSDQGRIVCVQHPDYVVSDNDDNAKLLQNILLWLVKK